MSADNDSYIYKNRIKNLKLGLKDCNLDNYLVLKYENIYYLTSFYGKDSNSVLLISEEKSYLSVNFIYYEEAKRSCSSLDIEVILYKKNRFERLIELFSSLKASTIGVEGDQLDYISYSKISDQFRSSGKRITGKKGIVEKLRLIKDSGEIENIKRSCRITDKAFENISNFSKEHICGYSELEVGIEIERLMIAEGGDRRSFDFIIASGTGSSMPHYITGHKKLNNGLLLMDFGTFYNNYCSDMTRTLIIGNGPLNDKLKKIYHIVLMAQEKAIEACKEGLTCGELDDKARKYINSRGYREEFGHGLGHGVGLEVHESPRVDKNNNTILKENMVITIEPGIYVPGFGGIRIEDMLLVKKNGCENLYNSKKEFTIIL
jgi:Xaa-Pro aminopeptidase